MQRSLGLVQLFALALVVGILALPAATALAAQPAFVHADTYAPPVSLQDLRHAVACPPFGGLEPYAQTCHDRIVAMIKEAATEIEFLEGAAAAARNAPKFTYRLNGTVDPDPAGAPVVTVTLEDDARHEEIARYSAPISTNNAALSAWISVVRSDMRRRVRKMPFECAVSRHAGRRTLTLDRGLSSGMKPGMVFYISGVEEEIIAPSTGEIIGRDSPVTYGKIIVFRVNARTAYARPLEGTLLPLRGRLFAHTF